MAEVEPSKEQGHGEMTITYTGLGAGDTLEAYSPPKGYDLESVQAAGTFGGESFMLTGSNSGGSVFGDLFTSAISAAGFAVPIAQSGQYSGALSGTGGGGDVDVYLLFRSRG